MTMVALGIDVSTKRVAIAALPEPGRTFLGGGTLRCDVLEVPPNKAGAQRLRYIRTVTHDYISRRYPDCAVCVVEIPWAKNDSSFALLSSAGVVMEAAQAATSNGAVVLDTPTPTWKLHSVGHGGSSKSQVMEYVRSKHGYEGDDQDVADAIAMAAAAWDLWPRHTPIRKKAA